MTGTNLGPKHDLAKRISALENAVQTLQHRDVLQNASIGQNGLTVNGGGSITVTGGGSIVITGSGSLTVAGGLNSGGTVAAQSTVTAGGDISSTGGSVSAAKNVSTGGSLSVGGGALIQGAATVGSLSSTGGITGTSLGLGSTGTVTSTYARNNSVSSSYVAAYINGDGQILASASSHTIKQDIEPADPRDLVDALYQLALIRFRYIDAVKEQGDAAAHELGSIVEYVATTPLREFVAYKPTGEPFAINWERFTIPLVAAVQDLDRRLRAAGL